MNKQKLETYMTNMVNQYRGNHDDKVLAITIWKGYKKLFNNADNFKGIELTYFCQLYGEISLSYWSKNGKCINAIVDLRHYDIGEE